MAPRLPMPRITLKRRPSSRNDSPGLSSVPASIEPIITLAAPAASAFTTSPEYLMPPSAITGTSPAPSTASTMAVICGTPTPVTTRVVQIEPGPTPTFTASTPRSTSARAPVPLATFPPTSCVSGNASRRHATVLSTPSAWPCAESTTITSQPASSRARARARASEVPPTAAATRRRPCWSLLAWGCRRRLKMSLMVMRPLRTPCSSTTGSFSMRCFARIRSASSSPVPTGAVTRRSLVIASRIGRSSSRSNCRSRLVMMPTRRPASSTIGTPEMWNRSIRRTASRSGRSGPRVIGCRIIPDSLRFTLSTSAAWRSTGMFLWITPMPPSRAMAIAISDSVTVSIAADTSGMLRAMPRVKRERTSTLRGCTLESRGTSKMSSNVRAEAGRKVPMAKVTPCSALDPEPALVQRNPMLAILPFHIAVPRLLERHGAESGREGQESKPLLHGDVDAVRSGVADDTADQAAGLGDATQCPPGPGHVLKVRRDHGVVRLLPAMLIALRGKALTHRPDVRCDRIQNGILEDRERLVGQPGDVLRARSHKVPSHALLQVTPPCDLPEERHFEPRRVGVVEVVRVRGGRNDEVRPFVADGPAGSCVVPVHDRRRAESFGLPVDHVLVERRHLRAKRLEWVERSRLQLVREDVLPLCRPHGRAFAENANECQPGEVRSRACPSGCPPGAAEGVQARQRPGGKAPLDQWRVA